MKRIPKVLVKVLSFAALVAVSLSSCDNEVQVPKVEQLKALEVSLDVSPAKSISSDHDREITHFSIASKIISATQKEFEVVGEFSGLTVAKGEGTAPTGVSLGLHTQGLWEFTVSACTKNGDVIYKGSSQQYISEAKTNKVVVALSEYTQGTGLLSLEFLSMTLAEPRLLVEYQRPNETAWTTLLDSTGSLRRNFSFEHRDDGYTRYTASDIPMQTGAYKLSIKLYNGEEVFSGEVLDTYVFEGGTTRLSGEFSISGAASFAVVDPGQTLKFTDAAAQLRIKDGTVVTGFHALGAEGDVAFPFSNSTSDVIYLIPIEAKQSDIFSGTSTVGGHADLKYIAFSSGFSSSPTAIGSGVFGDTSLEAIYAPDVSSVGEGSFQNTRIWDVVTSPLRTISKDAFKGSGLPEPPTMHPGVSIGDGAFAGSSIGSVEIPSSATLGTGAFEGCSSLLKTSIGTSLIPASTFKDCTGLVDISLSNTTEVGESAFEGCSSLKTVELPQTIRRIGSKAFKDCSGLEGTFHVPGSIGTDGGDRYSSITDCNAIGAQAFSGTSALYDLFIDRTNGDLSGEPWGAGCTVTYWAYRLHFDANQGTKDGDDDAIEFPQITQRNGSSISPIEDPKYRLVSYNAQMGMTLDGYPFPIPTRSGYGFIGWYDKADISGAARITERTVNTKREDQTVYAQWKKGLVTIIFNAGRDIYDNIATATETYRPVRYLENYGRIAAEEQEDDVQKSLPTSSIAGRTFLGWYFEDEPRTTKNGFTYFDEEKQSSLTPVVDSTIVRSKKGHVLYAHFRSHIYTVAFDSNLPSGDPYLKKNGSSIGSIASISLRFVKYGFTFRTTWRTATDKASSSWMGSDAVLPDLNTSAWSLDHHYFVGWYYDAACSGQKILETTKVPAQSSNGAMIQLYARWIGKEKNVTFKSVEYTPPTLYDAESTSTRTIDSYIVRYTGTFGRSVMTNDVKNDYADYAKALPTPTRTGYAFEGWYRTETAAKSKDKSKLVTADTKVDTPTPEELFAAWTPNDYTVTFDPQGGTTPTSSKTVTYHLKYGTLPVPTRTGYKFVGWFQSNVRSEGYGYSGARTTQDTYVHTAGNHTLYAAWVSYELSMDQNTTNTNFSPTNLNSSASISYSGRTATYTITPQTTGYYKNSSNSANNPTMVFEYTAVQIPTTNGKRTNGIWSDNGSDAVSDLKVECVELSSGGTNGSSSSNMTTGTKNVSVTPQKPGTRTFAVYDANYYGSSKTNDSSASYAKRNKIVYTCHGDSTGFSIEGADKLDIRDVSSFKVKYANATTHESQRGATWSIQTALDSNYDKITNGGILTVGYEVGTMVIKATSNRTLPSGVGTSATKNVTIGASAGFVFVAKGSSISFTAAAESSNTSKAIPSGQVITGFKPYERSSSQSAVDFAYTNSTDHKVWLEPIYSAESAAGSGSSLKYCAFSPSRTTLNSNTLSGDTNLIACWMPDTITSIGSKVFYNCTKLTDFHVSSSLSSADTDSFYNVPNHWYEYTGGNPSTSQMAFRWKDVYNLLSSYGSSWVTNSSGTMPTIVSASGTYNGISIGSMVYWAAVADNVDDKIKGTTSSGSNYVDGTSGSYTLPSNFPAVPVYYRARGNQIGWWAWGGTDYARSNMTIKCNGSEAGTYGTTEGSDTVTLQPGNSFSWSCSKSKTWGGTTVGVKAKVTAHCYGTLQWTKVFSNGLNLISTGKTVYGLSSPGSSLGTSNPSIVINGTTRVNCPMSAGSSWTSGVTQYYKSNTFSVASIAASHTTNGSYVSLKDIDTASTTTVSNPTSLNLGGSTVSASNGSTRIAATSGALNTNGSSRNVYYRDLRIRVGYW